MSSFADILAAGRRGVVLAALAEDADHTLNEDTIRSVQRSFGHDRLLPGVVRGDLTWLAERELIQIEELTVGTGKLWLCRLTQDGLAVARGRLFEGVDPPRR